MERFDRLLRGEIRFIHSAEFEKNRADRRILGPSQTEPVARPGRLKAPKDVPGHLAHLWQTALLTPDEEVLLFRRMNFRKFRAAGLLERLNRKRPSQRTMDRIETLLGDAKNDRNHIVQANMRLVVSIARKFVTDAQSFDELVSDGNLTLMRAADCFDYSRGFRFSTYATHSIRRDLYRRSHQTNRRRYKEFTTASPEVLDAIHTPESSDRHVTEARQLDHVVELMGKYLKERDQQILDFRYGLTTGHGLSTLREVGRKLGISKERVRQLQVRALRRIQQLAVAEQSG